MTGIGPVAVRQPRVREVAAADPGRIRFTPAILLPYARRSKSVEALLPLLYLKGICTGDFLTCWQGCRGAVGIDDWPTKGRLAGQVCAMAGARSVGEALRLRLGRWHLPGARLGDEKQCILVLIRATPEGKKELVGFTDGARESAHDWRNLLLQPKRRGLQVVARVGDR